MYSATYKLKYINLIIALYNVQIPSYNIYLSMQVQILNDVILLIIVNKIFHCNF